MENGSSKIESTPNTWWGKFKEKWFDFGEVFEENKLSLFYAMLAVLNNFASGISSFIIGPTQTDLTYIYRASPMSIQYFNTCYYSGCLFGSSANLIYKWFNRQLLLVFFVMIVSITISLVPHYTYLPVAYFFITINGLATGAWNAGCFIWMIEVWPSRIAELFQVNQFFYNVGAVMANVITKPFVYGDAQVNSENRLLTAKDRKWLLTVPYTLNAYLQSIIPFIFFALYFVKSYQARPISGKTHNHNMNPFLPTTKISKRKRKLTLFFAWNLLYYLGEIGYYQYYGSMFTELGFDADTIHYLTVGYNITYTLGPLVTIFICLRVRIDYIIAYHYVIIAFGLMVNYFGSPSATFVIIGNVLLGFGFSPMLPAQLTFAEVFLKFSEQNSLICTTINAFVWLVVPFIMQYGFILTPWFVFYYEVVLMPVSALLFIAFRWWMFHNSNSFNLYLESFPLYFTRKKFAT